MFVISAAELQRFVAAIPERSAFGARDRALVTLLSHTGLRISELCGLRVEHVANLVDRTVRKQLCLPAAACKGHRSRTVPLNREAQLAVRTILQFNRARGFAVDTRSPLFFNRHHRPLTPRAVQLMFQVYRKKAGLYGVTPHKCRHHFAAQVLATGGNVRQLQVLLGHRTLNTVPVYTYNDPAALAEVVSRL